MVKIVAHFEILLYFYMGNFYSESASKTISITVLSSCWLVGKIRDTEVKKSPRTLILGIGNPILRDDRVGHLLVQILRSRFSGPGIEFQETSKAGLNLAELLAGFDSAIVIDAIQNGGIPGEVYCLKPRAFSSQKANQSDQHRTGLLQALELGKSLGWPMPEDVTIVAIEAEDATSFGEDLTPAVEKAIPVALDKILHLLESRQEQPDETPVKKTRTKQSVAMKSVDFRR